MKDMVLNLNDDFFLKKNMLFDFISKQNVRYMA